MDTEPVNPDGGEPFSGKAKMTKSTEKFSLDQWIVLLASQQFWNWVKQQGTGVPFPGISSADMVPEMYRRGLIPRVFNCSGTSRDVVRIHLRKLAQKGQLISAHQERGQTVFTPSRHARDLYERLLAENMLEYALSKKGARDLTEMFIWANYFTLPKVLPLIDLAQNCAVNEEKASRALLRLQNGIHLPPPVASDIQVYSVCQAGMVRLSMRGPTSSVDPPVVAPPVVAKPATQSEALESLSKALKSLSKHPDGGAVLPGPSLPDLQAESPKKEDPTPEAVSVDPDISIGAPVAESDPTEGSGSEPCEFDFGPDLNEWVHQEAARTGLTPIEIVKVSVAQARQIQLARAQIRASLADLSPLLF